VRKYFEAKQGIVLRAIFFINSAAFGCWLTFFNIYLKEKIGFNTSQIGVLSSILPFGTLIILPIWGMLADKFVRKRVFLVALFVSMVMINGILLINNYYLFILFLFLFGSFYSPLTPMLDTIALDYVEQTGKDSYGEIRLWSSAGWAFSTLVVGYLLRGIDVKFVFPITSAFFVVSGIIMSSMYKPLKVKRNIATLKFAHLGKIIIDSPRLIIFIVIILIYGILTAPVMLFINLYYNEIGGQSQHIGIAFTVQAMCELPFFFYGKRILERFGAKRVMVFAMSVTMIRMLLYGITNDPIIAIMVGGLHGITIALFLISVIEQIHAFIPQEWRATGQSFIYIFYFGVGTALGYIWAGHLSELYSVQKTMLFMGGLIFILIMLTVFIFYIFRKIDQKRLSVDHYR
jgi:MFS transporter, PPP family, 3-phenylpropionic acid transporter